MGAGGCRADPSDVAANAVCSEPSQLSAGQTFASSPGFLLVISHSVVSSFLPLYAPLGGEPFPFLSTPILLLQEPQHKLTRSQEERQHNGSLPTHMDSILLLNIYRVTILPFSCKDSTCLTLCFLLPQIEFEIQRNAPLPYLRRVDDLSLPPTGAYLSFSTPGPPAPSAYPGLHASFPNYEFVTESTTPQAR